MRDRWGLLQRGLFPETLPPCFTSKGIRNAFSGLVNDLKAREFLNKRETDYVRYNGTKHDRSRRYFGTPNPISYFYVSNFIAEYWGDFESRFKGSPFTVSAPRVGLITDDRPILIPSLSELTTVASKKIGASAYILKTDISQFFPSVYTHSIPWSAHGIEAAKRDAASKSTANYFNRLDLAVRNCQRGETRGVLVGPDAFRLISEFIVCGIDRDLFSESGKYIIGAARHVDDYYIGIGSEVEALAVLSSLRDRLQRYSLQINDVKTRTMFGVEPLNDVWAQSLRKDVRDLARWTSEKEADAVLLLNRSMELSLSIGSDSPVKISLRAFDKIRIYQTELWYTLEPYLQRLMFHHPHCIDYVALIVAKRISMARDIDGEGWGRVCHALMARHLSLGHHHEVVWLLWLMIISKLKIDDQLIEKLSSNQNGHIRALVIAAFSSGAINKKPKISLGSKLATTDENWLTNIVARTSGFSGAPFSGALAGEFEHITQKNMKFIDLKSHLNAVRALNAQAISRTRYGYDSDEEEEEEEEEEDDDIFAGL